MIRIKTICSFLCVGIVASMLSSCTNNLVNKWENYTGDTDVYYNPPETTTLDEDDKVLAEYDIPDYWLEELQSAVSETNSVIKGSNNNYTAFLWYTDAHWSYSAQRSVALLKYLQDHADVQFVNFGGDIVSDNSEVEHDEIVSTLDEWREGTLKLSNHHSVVGNHDDDIPEFEDRDDLYSFLLEYEVVKVSDTNNKFCYYVDDSSEKTRYIYLSTGFDETTADDISFLVNTLNNTKKDWHIVLVSHIWFAYDSTLTPTEGSVPEFVQVILDVADAYNARLSGNAMGVDYSFASAEAKVEFCIGGHTHVDYDFYTVGGIPVVLTETDSYHLRGDDKKLDKTDEASVNVVVADYNAGLIRIIRAGRGNGRTVSLTNQ